MTYRRRRDLLHYSPPPIFCFEVRVGKAKEQAPQLTFSEVVWQKLHCVLADYGTVAKLAWRLLSKSANALPHILSDLLADLHAENELIRKHLGQRHSETSIAAAQVYTRDLWAFPPVERGGLSSAAVLRREVERWIFGETGSLLFNDSSLPSFPAS